LRATSMAVVDGGRVSRALFPGGAARGKPDGALNV
jgi:hypothetical protein